MESDAGGRVAIRSVADISVKPILARKLVEGHVLISPHYLSVYPSNGVDFSRLVAEKTFCVIRLNMNGSVH